MESQQYINDMQSIQCQILKFLEDESNDEENFVNLKNLFDDQKITEHSDKFKSLLYLISSIGNNHFRSKYFFNKLEKILNILQADIKKYCTDFEIFNIFYKNMKLLLFLLEEKVLVFDEYFLNEISKNEKYIMYFTSEINEFPSKSKYDKIKILLPFNLDEKFYKLRQIGENENEICKLIRNDMVTEFISYINHNSITINAIIKKSQYETNTFLHNKKVTLIKYAAFFGSIQIFNYLLRQHAELDPSIWYYAIHGKNVEIIQELQKNNIKPDNNSYLSSLIESIKCHHNDIANYILANFLDNDDENLMNIFNKILKYYNFSFMKNEFINESSFYKLCKNNYITLVEFFLKTKDVDVNEKHKDKTLLYYAVENDQIEIINLLINNDKLDINAYSTNNYDDDIFQEKTALYLAVENENIEIVKLLLSNKKIDINILNKMNNYMETALHLAVYNENIDIIKVLIINDKIDVNIPSEEIYYKKDESCQKIMCKNIINTPLHAAVYHNNVEIVKLLVNHKKINLHIKNIEGKTPKEIAENDQIKQLFPDYNS